MPPVPSGATISYTPRRAPGVSGIGPNVPHGSARREAPERRPLRAGACETLGAFARHVSANKHAATVDVQDLAGDVAGEGRGEKDHRPRDVVGGGGAPQRDR